MVRMRNVLMLSGLVAAGCAPAEQHIVRAQLGVNSRHVVMPTPSTASPKTIGHVTNHMDSADAPLDQVLRGAMCCRNLRSPDALSCRAAAPGESGSVKPYYCRRF